MSNIEENAFQIARYLLENRQKDEQIEIIDALELSDEDFRLALKFLVDAGNFRTAGQFGKGIIIDKNLAKLQNFVNQMSDNRISLSGDAERLLKFLFGDQADGFPFSICSVFTTKFGWGETQYIQAAQELDDKKMVTGKYAGGNPFFEISVTKKGRETVRNNFRLSSQRTSAINIENSDVNIVDPTTLRHLYHQEKKTDRIRNQVFISYSHKDKRWLERLQIHLKPLERESLIARWDDSMINSGENWREEIRKAIKSAKVAVLLITADFLASDFIAKDELPPLLAAAETDGAVILPLIVSASRFQQIENLSKFQAINPPSRPMNKMQRGQQEEIFVKLTNDIEKALKQSTNDSRFIPISVTSSTLANYDLSIYTRPPYGQQEFHGIPFHVENARISMADIYDGNYKTFKLKEPIIGVGAIHFLINAGDGRKRYGEITIGFIEFIFKDGALPIQRFEIKLAKNIREWAIGNFVTTIIDGRQQHDPLVDSVDDTHISREAWRGMTTTGQVAVIDMLKVEIDKSMQNKALIAIRFTRDIPQGKYALDYFVSGITVELLK